MSAQAPVVEFLLDAASHGAGVDRVEQLDTHISRIFLAGERAYKMKRDVVFPFLDFSTLAKRHAAAVNELRINRRISPQLYLGLSAVQLCPDGRLVLVDDPEDGAGEVVEWLVRMRRFPQRELYSARADRGAITERDAMALADMVRALHAASPISRDASSAFADLQEVHAENVAFLGEHPRLIDASSVASLLVACDAMLRDGRALLAGRVADGYCRHCHGDLHLGNIVQVDGQPLAFDAIEFNDRMATIDVLYDLAFLLMDLWHHGLRAHANLVLNRYLGAGPDDVPALPGLCLLPLFLSLRALIRLKAAVWKAEASDLPAARAVPAGRSAEAAAYAELAFDCLRRRPAGLIAIGGLSGTGKTSVARSIAWHLGPPPGAVILRSDVERKALFGVAETSPLPPAAYAEATTERVYAVLLEKAERILAAGYTAIIDAVSARPAQRAALEALAARAGVPFRGFWLSAPAAMMVARVSARHGDASDADQAVVRRQLGYDLGELRWTVVDAAGDIAATAAIVRASLEVAAAG
jgi:aminoglycoside phosphotransferase family enzyme/predicted kinase